MFKRTHFLYSVVILTASLTPADQWSRQDIYSMVIITHQINPQHSQLLTLRVMGVLQERFLKFTLIII